jgi:hypothetical protein
MWHQNTNNPVCENCAPKHRVSELPDWGKAARAKKGKSAIFVLWLTNEVWQPRQRTPNQTRDVIAVASTDLVLWRPNHQPTPKDE